MITKLRNKKPCAATPKNTYANYSYKDLRDIPLSELSDKQFKLIVKLLLYKAKPGD